MNAKAAPWLSALPDSVRRGFTLLEMVLVMFIISLLITTVFGIVNSVTQLTNDMTVEQQRDARAYGFIELCGRAFRNLPPSAMVRLRNHQTGGHLTSQLALVGASSPLSGDAGAVITLETEEAIDGYLRVFMRSMNAAQAVAWEKGDAQAGVRVPLLENVALLEWKFFDPRSGEWTSLWNDKINLTAPADPAAMGGSASLISGVRPPRPAVLELRLAYGTEPPQRRVFWVPPAEPIAVTQNPRPQSAEEKVPEVR